MSSWCHHIWNAFSWTACHEEIVWSMNNVPLEETKQILCLDLLLTYEFPINWKLIGAIKIRVIEAECEKFVI